jgi:aryl-alcohol dehydrogenase-like predicted oxidoreductase
MLVALPAPLHDRAHPVMGLGLAALGRPGYLTLDHGADLGADRSVAALERNAHRVLDAAYAAGIRYFDAARSYGLAEAFLGSWLERRALAPGEVMVASKWGYTYTAGWQVQADPPEVKDLSASTFRRQLRETRQLLGDHLAVYQIHSATVESGVLEDRELLDELSELRASGVAIGLTTTGPQQAAAVDQALEAGGFDSVQATWNLLEPSAAAALSRAHEQGLRVVVKEALANGRLTSRGRVEALEAVAARLGAGPDAVALATALAQPWADVVLSGAATVDQVQSNVSAQGLNLDDEALAALGSLPEPAESYWRRRSELAWN